MLFGPDNGEQLRDPDMEGGEAVEAGVAGGTDGDQERWLANVGPTTVDVELCVPCPTAPALILVALEDDFPVSAEVIPRVPAGPITAGAEPGHGGIRSPHAQNSGFCWKFLLLALRRRRFGPLARGEVRRSRSDYKAKVVIKKKHYHKPNRLILRRCAGTESSWAQISGRWCAPTPTQYQLLPMQSSRREVRIDRKCRCRQKPVPEKR